MQKFDVNNLFPDFQLKFISSLQFTRGNFSNYYNEQKGSFRSYWFLILLLYVLAEFSIDRLETEAKSIWLFDSWKLVLNYSVIKIKNQI